MFGVFLSPKLTSNIQHRTLNIEAEFDWSV
jgi:hypothetical protein